MSLVQEYAQSFYKNIEQEPSIALNRVSFMIQWEDVAIVENAILEDNNRFAEAIVANLDKLPIDSWISILTKLIYKCENPRLLKHISISLEVLGFTLAKGGINKEENEQRQKEVDMLKDFLDRKILFGL